MNAAKLPAVPALRGSRKLFGAEYFRAQQPIPLASVIPPADKPMSESDAKFWQECRQSVACKESVEQMACAGHDMTRITGMRSGRVSGIGAYCLTCRATVYVGADAAVQITGNPSFCGRETSEAAS